MKTLSLAVLLVASLAAVMLGCSDNSSPIVTPSGVNQDAAAPLMKTTGSGAWVFKYDDLAGFWFLDESGLLVTIGINDLTKFCDRTPVFLDEFGIKDIYLPNADPELRRIIEQIKGTDVAAMAFQVVPGSATTLRGYVCGKTPVAVGTANFKYNDNDVLAWDQENNNSNAFGYKANGTLEGPEGQTYLLNLVYRVVWDPGTTKFQEVFKLQLTPTGK